MNLITVITGHLIMGVYSVFFFLSTALRVGRHLAGPSLLFLQSSRLSPAAALPVAAAPHRRRIYPVSLLPDVFTLYYTVTCLLLATLSAAAHGSVHAAVPGSGVRAHSIMCLRASQCVPCFRAPFAPHSEF